MVRYTDRLSRRKFIGAGSAAGIGLLAGCSGDGSTETDGTGENDGTTNETSSGDSGLVEPRFDYSRGRPATEIQMNPFSPANYGQTFAIPWNVGLVSSHSDGQIRNHLIEGTEVDGREITISLPEGWTFWNGDEITAEDLMMEMEINRLQDPETSQYESHEVVDDYTVRRTFKNEAAPFLMRSSLYAHGILHGDTYREFYESYTDATTQDERDSVTEELNGFTIDVQQFMDDGLGIGMYELDNFNSQYAEGVLNEDHPWAEKANIPRFRLYNRNAEEEAMIKEDNLDRMMRGIRDEERDQFPDNIQNVGGLDWFRTQKFMLNWNNDHLANINVRRAIMSAMPLDSMSDAAVQSGYNASPTQVQTGIRSSIHSEFLGDDFVDSLIDYPVESDLDVATDYMEQAGYSQSGGTWASPDGEEVTFNILTRTNQGSNLPTQVFADTLSQFGIETEINAVGSDYYTRVQNYEFDMAWMWHVAQALWHPVAYYSNDFYGLRVGDPSSTEGTGDTGIPLTYEIPSEVGSEEISGNGNEIHAAQLCNQLPAAGSQEDVVDMTQTLAWFWNYSLPGIVYIQENQSRAMDTGSFTFPENPDKPLSVTNYVENGLIWGEIQGKTA